MKYFFGLLTVTLLFYLAYTAYFYINQQTILFPRHLITSPVASPSVPGMERMWLEISEGQVEAWYLAPSTGDVAAPLFIIAHGNGDLIDYWLADVLTLRQMGIGVLLVEYPGYGRSQGTPSYQAIRETFLLAYDTIIRNPKVDPQRVLLFGHSIGGGAISILAAERPSSGLIFLSAFTNVSALATEHWLPSFVVRDNFDNLTIVQTYSHPILIFHGRQDGTIPYHHSVALQAAAQQGKLISLECGHGGCIKDWERFWHDLVPFFVKAGVLK